MSNDRNSSCSVESWRARSLLQFVLVLSYSSTTERRGEHMKTEQNDVPNHRADLCLTWDLCIRPELRICELLEEAMLEEAMNVLRGSFLEFELEPGAMDTPRF
jgi:hypothetical protein